MPPIRSSARRRQAGFTVIELTVSLIVIVEVLFAVLMLFDFSNKVSHVQTNIADMQQTLRIAQNEMESMIRTAGRGGLTWFNTAPGGPVWMRDNVAAGATVGDATSPVVATGTDVLYVRGVFSTPMYQVQDPTSLAYFDASGNPKVPPSDPTGAYTGKVTLQAQTSLENETLQSLADAVTAGVHEALVITDAANPDVHAVVELLPAQSTVNVGTSATIYFRIQGTPSDMATYYRTLILGGAYPPIKSISELGILEEWRFYIRKNTTAADIAPKLAKAHFMPGSDIAYGPPAGPNNAQNLSIDLADDVLDLQVALALDTVNHVARTPVPGEPAEPAGLTTIHADPEHGYISEAANGATDDWLYNSTSDNVTTGEWLGARLMWARVSLLARTDRRDAGGYQAPLLTKIEDHAYLSTDPLNASTERMYRRRVVQTVIDVRNQ
jgi:hypothetical protein